MFDPQVAMEGMGRDSVGDSSPDGLGAYAVPPSGSYPQPTESSPNPPMYYGPQGPQQMQGEVEFIEPEDTSDGAAMKSAGFTLLFVALSTGIGYAWKGGHGAISGLLLSAGTANAYRSQKWFSSEDPGEKHEAIVSGLFAAGEIFGGLFVGYHAMKRSDRNRD